MIHAVDVQNGPRRGASDYVDAGDSETIVYAKYIPNLTYMQVWPKVGVEPSVALTLF